MADLAELRTHAARLLVLGIPLMGSQLAQLAIQITDTVMLGRYDVTALAGQVLGSSLFVVLLLMGSGFGWAVMPMVAEADSAGRLPEIRRVTRMGLWLSAGFAAISMPPMLMAQPLFLALGQEPEPARLASAYLAIQGWSIFPALFVMVLRSFLAGLALTRAVLLTTMIAVVLNAAVNYALIFGNWGAPELGIIGAAWASILSNLAQCLMLAVYAFVKSPEHAIFRRLWKPDSEALGRVFRLGWPIGLTTLAEVGLFTAAAVMIGWLGTAPLAAHGIAMQVTSIVFMLHLGLSQAATIRAGNALGRGDGRGLRQGAAVAVGFSAVLAVGTSAFLLAMPGPLVALFVDPADPARDAVVALGAGLIIAAAVFQLVDAAQVMALGLLRGVQDTRRPMVLAAVSYWLIGIPAGWVFGFPMGGGGVGVWLGMALGLTVAAVTMQWRFWRRDYVVNGSEGYVTAAR
ncbi:MATE family efflux transporter [Palleronia sediminis]|uniref:Multidrug-efflux transporter n=1 Tax=Palleronia sediminis TaxID=2547833 RepID=A0A4V3B8S5_9RHOB|nr:MATE family efflux transporter [Palleronia sediminis]TDL76249.1 MATE family efflux transporter [Palleronia sediminis]